MFYRVYGIVISSDEIISLPPSLEAKADVRIRRLPKADFSSSPNRWFMQWHFPGGELWLSFAKVKEGYLLRFKELADFFISEKGKEIVCMPQPETPKETINHLLLDQVIPLVINLKAGESLHVSAVLATQGVVAFSGETGSGKSTLAGVFLNAGYPLLSDDCLVLKEKDDCIMAVPAYPGLRLWEDSLACLFGDNSDHELVAHYTRKRRVDIENNHGAYCDEPQPLRCLYEIVSPTESGITDDIVIEKLTPQDSLMTLIRYAFRLDITDRAMLTRQIRFLGRVASSISVRRLIFPRDLNLIPSVREAILNDLKNNEN